MPNSLQPHGLFSPWNSPGQNTGVGSLSLLQGLFPTQGSNPGLPHCGRILYQLSHQGRKGMLLISGSCSVITSVQKASDSMSFLVLSAVLHLMFFLPGRSVQEQDKKDKTSSHPGAPTEHSSPSARRLAEFHGLVLSTGSARPHGEASSTPSGSPETLPPCFCASSIPQPTPGDKKRLTGGITEKN